MNDLFADDTILARWLNNELTKAELVSLQQHEAYADLLAIVKEMDQLRIAEDRDVRADYDRLRARLDQAQEKNKVAPVRKLHYGRWAAAAAVVFIAFAGWLWLRPQATVYATQTSERKEINFPDGSQALLNADSELRVYQQNWSVNRKVVLSGEAFFKVKAGTPFSVSTANGQVEVVGTEFNVYSRNDILESWCTSGKIRTISENGKISQTSTAGQGVRLSNNQLQFTFTVNPETSQWPDGQSYFERVPLPRVIAELERQFSIDIQYDPSLFSATDAFNGYFDNRNLAEALRNVFLPMQIKYVIEGNKVRLMSE